MTLFIALFFTSIMFLQGLAPLQWCSPFVVQKRCVWLLWFFAAATTRHTMHASSSGARLWLDIVPSCPVSFFFFLSGPLCFYLQHSLFLLSHPTLPRSTESRPRFHWPVSTFPLSHRRLVGSAHKERAANHRRPLINLGQCPRLSYLHSDVASQSGVGTGEDFDPSTQWLREV